MRPVVDIIGDVVTAMKPTIPVDGVFMTRDGAIDYITVSKTVLNNLFEGERLKIVFAEGTYYCEIDTITESDLSFTVTLTDDNFASAPLSVAVVLNYHYGHLLEMKNRFIEITQNPNFKQAQFPAVILVQDFPEKMDNRKHERIATLRMFILTDSKQQYEAPDRYTNTFKPVLYSLEALLFSELEKSLEVSIYDQEYTRIDRLFWGRVQDQGTASNIFADFIDAIEINDLKIKILNTC